MLVYSNLIGLLRAIKGNLCTYAQLILTRDGLKKEGRLFSGPKSLDVHRRGRRCSESKAVKRGGRCDEDHSGRHRVAATCNLASPSIWWCTRARSRASATASWSARCRTAATSSGGDPVINRRMDVADAMVLGRGPCRAGVAENDCDENCNCCLAQHFYLLVELRHFTPMGCRLRPTQQ